MLRFRMSAILPCPDLPQGFWVLIHSSRDWMGPRSRKDFPEKQCVKCRLFRLPLDFVVTWDRASDGYIELMEHSTPVCRDCYGRVEFPLGLDASGKLRMRHESLRDARGEPHRWFDTKSKRWKAFVNRGIRWMKDDGIGNQLRLQPYTERKPKRKSPYERLGCEKGM